MPFKRGQSGNPAGKPKGTINRETRDIKEMIIGALCAVGGINYLARQAEQNPAAFMTLVGKVLPTQLTGANGDSLGAQHLIAASAMGLELVRIASEYQPLTNGHAVTIETTAIDLDAQPPEE